MQAPDERTPETIAEFRVLRRLATGGTSDVLLARAEGPHGFARVVVLKRLLAQYQNDPQSERMFAREASAYARLSHPAIVKLYDFFAYEGQLVIVLEYVDGLPLNKLRALLRAHNAVFDDRAALYVGARIFSALAAAHTARDPGTGRFSPVIHRDVNPSNVLIPWDGHVKLADFGLAKVTGVSQDTQAGLIKGTFGYMAPEQVRGEGVTVRADVYAGALIVWELLTGRKAIERGKLSDLEVLRAMEEPQIPSLDTLRPDLPKALRDALQLGLATSPERRSIFADELVNVLRNACDLDEGRQLLSEALANVRPPVSSEEMAADAMERGGAAALAATLPATSTSRRSPSVSDTQKGMAFVPNTTPTRRDLPAANVARRGARPVPPRPASRPPEPTPMVLLEAVDATPTPPLPDKGVSASGSSTLSISRPRPPTASSPSLPVIRRADPPLPTATLRGLSAPDSDSGLAETVRPPAATEVDLDGPEEAREVERSHAATAPRLPVAAPFKLPSYPPPPPPKPGPVVTPFQATVPLERVAPPPPLLPKPMEPSLVPASYGGGFSMQPTTNSTNAGPRVPMPSAPYRRSDGKGWTVAAVLGGVIAFGTSIGALVLLRPQMVELSLPSPKPAMSTVPTTPPLTDPPLATNGTPAPPPPVTTAATLVSTATPIPLPPPSIVAAAKSAAPPPAAPIAVTADARTCDLDTSAARPGHRVYFDGRVLGETPRTFRVPCGGHEVKLGSSGSPQRVDLPCGGAFKARSR